MIRAGGMTQPGNQVEERKRRMILCGYYMGGQYIYLSDDLITREHIGPLNLPQTGMGPRIMSVMMSLYRPRQLWDPGKWAFLNTGILSARSFVPSDGVQIL
jgi:hypothetical protein